MPKTRSPGGVSTPSLMRQDSSPFELYGPPEDMSVCDALYEIFCHYCSPWKTAISNDQHAMMIDSMSFVRLCKEAPALESSRVGRHEFDLVFTKAREDGNRRLDFQHFLQALLDLATRKYPDDDPPTAYAKLLVRNIFGLFDQPSSDNPNLVEMVRDELE
jgi:hypothetical protein